MIDTTALLPPCLRQIEGGIETANNKRKEKLALELRLRRLRILHNRKRPPRPLMPSTPHTTAAVSPQQLAAAGSGDAANSVAAAAAGALNDAVKKEDSVREDAIKDEEYMDREDCSHDGYHFDDSSAAHVSADWY